MTINRSTLLKLSSLALLSGALVLATPLLAQGSVSNPSATTVLAAAKVSLAKERGVHVKVKTLTGSVVSSVIADIGRTSGTETYVSGKESFTITVTPTYAYLSGSATGLTTLMGLTSTEQKKVGTASISMKMGTTQYTTFQSNLTSGAFAQLLPVAKGTNLLSARDKSTNGYDLKWTTKATSATPSSTSVLTISSGKKTLPLKEAVSTSVGSSATTFTKWGESVTVTVPSSTIAYAKVFPTGG